MLAAYFDDSGTHDDSAVVSWGGFVGTDTQWTAFNAAWRTKLAAPLPGKPLLRKFGLADCERRRNEFFGYSGAESDLLQNEMREIIVKHRLLGVCYSVDRSCVGSAGYRSSPRAFWRRGSRLLRCLF